MATLYTMKGPAGQKLRLPEGFPDPRDLSDVDAGLHYLATIAHYFPDITFRDLHDMGHGKMSGWADSWQYQFPQLRSMITPSVRPVESMAGWLTDLGHAIAMPFNWLGDKAGDIVRLASDPKVSRAVTKAGAAYATGGASSVFDGIFSGGSSTGNADIMAQLGQAWKSIFGGSTPGAAGGSNLPAGVGTTGAPKWVVPVILGLGGASLVALLMKKKPQPIRVSVRR